MPVRKKAGASKRKTGKSKTSKAVITVKVGGVNKRYTRTSCSATKSGATKAAESIRKEGFNARVLPGGSGRFCVYKGGKTSSKAPGRARSRA